MYDKVGDKRYTVRTRSAHLRQHGFRHLGVLDLLPVKWEVFLPSKLILSYFLSELPQILFCGWASRLQEVDSNEYSNYTNWKNIKLILLVRIKLTTYRLRGDPSVTFHPLRLYLLETSMRIMLGGWEPQGLLRGENRHTTLRRFAASSS